MRIVIDTNVLMAGLLKDSIVRKILVSEKINFFIPDYALKEVYKYKKELCIKSGYTQKEFDYLVNLLLENIKIVPLKILKKYMIKAEEIMRGIDIKDSPFIATSFSINADGIWSFDKDFLEQKEIRVFHIKELLRYIRKS